MSDGPDPRVARLKKYAKVEKAKARVTRQQLRLIVPPEILEPVRPIGVDPVLHRKALDSAVAAFAADYKFAAGQCERKADREGLRATQAERLSKSHATMDVLEGLFECEQKDKGTWRLNKRALSGLHRRGLARKSSRSYQRQVANSYSMNDAGTELARVMLGLPGSD